MPPRLPGQDVNKLYDVDNVDEVGEREKLMGSSNDEPTNAEASRYMASTIALCMCTLNNAWLLISVFPYSGFMAIDLIPGLNKENAGSYAGLIASSFMLGRSLSSYGWGHMADTYGRTTVLRISLILCCIFTLLFGTARSFTWALVWRFLLGFSNGIIGTVKTAVSELAKGNEKLETRGMGLVMGMWGWGFLVCPAFSGMLAEPIRQYPNNQLLQEPWIRSVLTKFPFLLPNLVGAISCILTMLAVHIHVEETLAKSERRSHTLICSDFFSWLKGLFNFCKPSVPLRCETIPLQSNGVSKDSTDKPNPNYQSNKGVSVTNGYIVWNNSSPSNRSLELVNDLDDDEEGDEDDAIRRSVLLHCESTLMLAVSPRNSIRKSITRNSPSIRTLRRRSFARLSARSMSDASADTNTSKAGALLSSPPPPPPTTKPPNTLSSLWSNVDTRNHLLVYWIYSFVSIQVDEAFPLFCISQKGGLGLSEDKIGKILSSSGVIFAICQYFVYTSIVGHFGLYQSIHLGSFLTAPIITLIPLSVVLSRSGLQNDNVVDTENVNHSLTWPAFLLLISIMASYRIFGNIFFSSITVATNRTVPASQRATMNGLSMLGGSVAKACGPTFAGFLVSFCLSSGMFPPRVGGALIFAVIGLLGMSVAVFALFLLKQEPDEDEDDEFS